MENKQQDETIKDRILGLLRKGYRRTQLINDFGFAERTVDAAIRIHKELNQDNAEDDKEGAGYIEDEGASVYPVPKNTSGSSQGEGPTGGQASKRKQELTKLGSKDVIPPEAILDVLHLPRNGDAVEVWRRGVLDGVGILLLGARYSQLTAAGQAEVIKSQLDILRESRESGMEMARQASVEAAAEAAARATAHIDQRFDQMEEKKRDIAETPDPMKGLMARTMESLINQITGQMFGGGQGGGQGGQPGTGIPPGWEDKTKAGGK